jgi:UDP-glucose 4-epimerase
LLEAGYKVVIVDNLYNSSKVALDRIELICGKRPDFYEVDMTDEAGLDTVFAAHPGIDSVIHFAALKVFLSNRTRISCTELSFLLRL